MSRAIKLPDDRENIKELTITILGNANSGKSTLTGVLTNPLLQNIIDKNSNLTQNIPKEILDDGDGKSRVNILQFVHERKTGRTSSITYKYMTMDNGYKVISFVDLAGHESYLKTTINGITSSYPDFAFICIEKNITDITKEHLRLVNILEIPFCILMTKIDLIPEDKLKENLKKVYKLVKQFNKKIAIIKKSKDLESFKNMTSNTRFIPVILISNVTGYGINYVIKKISTISKRENKLVSNAFVIDNIFNVTGFGLVVSGLTTIEINKNDDLYLGPFNRQKENKGFIKVKVRTLHDDYRNFVNVLKPNKRGCICIKIPNYLKNNIRSGLVLVKSINDVNPVKKFRANIQIFHGHATTIKPGYSAFINSGIIKSCVKFINILDKDGNIKDETSFENCMRSGDSSIVEIEFLKNKYCVVTGEKFIFREGRTRGIGIII